MIHKDSPYRSLAKAASWRIIASIATFSLAYVLTNQISISLAIGGIDVILKFILYFAHERVWEQIRFGRVTKDG